MMTLTECLVCGAIYQPIQDDGLIYYHRCPPVPNPAYQPNPRTPGYDPRDVIDIPFYRDENVRGGTGPDAHRPRSIGRGARVLPERAQKETDNE